ncbi:MAG TPA: hypothetical protein VFT98_13525 [Myxococcota bacterium]|nr:hypothetical protein [Myxococcota bacterium]
MSARAGAVLAFGLLAAVAHADDAARIEALELRVAELEARLAQAEPAAPRSGAPLAASHGELPITLSAAARVGWFGGGDGSDTNDIGASVRDARFFLDAELAEDLRAGARPLVRNVGFSFEWNLVRRGELFNDVGDLYVDLQGIGGSPWLNLRPGRFQIPIGELYPRYGRALGSDPFISKPLGGPWWWDEGVMLYGASESERFGYVASLTNGETPLSFDEGGGEQATLKLWLRPRDWLRISASGLYGGEIGSGGGALWLGETWATPIGAMGSVPIWIDGAPAAPSAARIDSTWLAGGDVVWTPRDEVRLWLGGGRYALDSRDAATYDRRLHYWIAELVLRGALLRPELAPAFFGVRADGIGTDDAGRGYLLSIDYVGTLGYNMRRYSAYTVVLGWQLGGLAALRAEYSLRDIDLVRGVPSALEDAARDADGFALELGVQF